MFYCFMRWLFPILPYESRLSNLLSVFKVDMRRVIYFWCCSITRCRFMCFFSCDLPYEDASEYLYAVASCHVAVAYTCPIIYCITLWCFMCVNIRRSHLLLVIGCHIALLHGCSFIFCITFYCFRVPHLGSASCEDALHLSIQCHVTLNDAGASNFGTGLTEDASFGAIPGNHVTVPRAAIWDLANEAEPYDSNSGAVSLHVTPRSPEGRMCEYILSTTSAYVFLFTSNTSVIFVTWKHILIYIYIYTSSFTGFVLCFPVRTPCTVGGCIDLQHPSDPFEPVPELSLLPAEHGASHHNKEPTPIRRSPSWAITSAFKQPSKRLILLRYPSRPKPFTNAANVIRWSGSLLSLAAAQSMRRSVKERVACAVESENKHCSTIYQPKTPPEGEEVLRTDF